MYARPLHRDAPLTFAVSGSLWRQALVMFDRETGTLWSQREHRAIAGTLDGTALERLSSEITDWGSWRRRHPNTLVLPSRDARGPILPAAPWRRALLALATAALIWMVGREISRGRAPGARPPRR